MLIFTRSLSFTFLLVCARLAAAQADVLVLGDPASEKIHQVEAGASRTVTGDYGEPARCLLPLPAPAWKGGSIAFTLQVDPEKPNYFTAKFSGDEANQNRLVLYIDGLQIGYRHLGDIEQLDYGTQGPACQGRFYYNTTPLPLELTRGKTALRFEIRSNGRIWGYGDTFEQYQKPMTEPSKAIYRVYTHTDGCFVPPPDEKQGVAPPPSVRPAPGVEVLDRIRERVNTEIAALLASKNPPGQMQLQLLAKAYDVSWTLAHANRDVTPRLLRGLDALYVAYVKNPRLAQADPATWNSEWFGLGVCGQVITLRHEQLKPFLDERIDDGRGRRLSRREAYTAMLVATRDWHRLNRRLYTNQTMINDLNGIYRPNRGIALLSPDKALSENEACRYLYESIGLIPWTGSDAGGRNWNAGDHYFQLTAKGLTKELGYVGSYGEVIDLVCDIYEATKPAPDRPGNPKIKDQLVKIALARAIFRHPSVDDDGHQAMRLEQVVGWRDSHLPGYIAYGQRASRDSSAIQAAALTRDPRLIGYAQQMLADNQFFASEAEALADAAQPLRTTIGRLATPDHYALIRSLPASSLRLPMSPDQPDFVWSDEEDGVLALKNGTDILYVSLYWRARYGINNLARVHYLTPACERLAVVRQQTEFTPQGADYLRPDQTNMAFGDGGVVYPEPLHSAHAGEILPVAKVPDEIPFSPGQENPYAGRGDFYTLRYGPYLVGMNMSTDKTFGLTVPSDVVSATDLRTGDRNIPPGTTRQIPPRSTVVLRLER